MLIKTLQPHEVQIILVSPFFKSYVEYLHENPKNMLSKFYGIYEIKVAQQDSIYFTVTENVIGEDFQLVNRCYDLKGSTFSRITEVTDDEKIDGSGLKVLKDLNFAAEDTERLALSDLNRNEILKQLDQDSKFLSSHKLMDYSLFLIIIDNKAKTPRDLNQSLVFDNYQKKYLIKEDEIDTIDKKTAPNKLSLISKKILQSQKRKDSKVTYAEIESSDGKYRYKFSLIDFLTIFTTQKYIEGEMKS